MTEVRRTTIEVRPLAAGEVREASRLHERELPHEFLTRFGVGFLARYYRAFVESPHATALCAVDARSGRVCGVLIGAFDVRAHYAFLVRRHGVALAARAALRAIRDPGLAMDLVRTRLSRYARGVFRSVAGAAESGDEPERVGLLAYVAVEERGRGVGGCLVGAFEELARGAGLERLELVTLPDERGAGPFYERIGWTGGGERVSRSGERYALYTRFLQR